MKFPVPFIRAMFKSRRVRIPAIISTALQVYTNIISPAIHDALRSWGTSIVGVWMRDIASFPQRAGPEPKKIAIYRSKFIWALSLLIHLLPIWACTSLAAINLRGFYLGSQMAGKIGHTQLKLLGLQVTSKLLELLILASLSNHVSSLIRFELLSHRGLPFGALTSSSQISSLSYLWSMELWALLFSPSMKKRHRFRFFGLLFLCALLGGVVGPAIATLLQPQLDFWPAGGTDLWLNSTLDRLFPPTLDMSTLPTLECATTGLDVCPTAGWETMNDWLRILYFTDRGDDYGRPSSTSWIPSTLSIPAQTVSLEPFYTIRPPVDDEFFAFSWMKLPHVGLAQALSTGSHLWWSAAIRASQNYGKGSRLWDKVTDQYSFVHLSPEVQTQCNHTLYNATALKACVPFRQAESPWETIEQCDNEAIEAWVSNDLENTRPTVHWIDGSSNWNGAPNISDLNLPGGYNAAALVTLPKTVSKDVHAIGCSVRVQYGVGTYTTESVSGKVGIGLTIFTEDKVPRG